VSAFPEVILILLLLMATLAWVLIYFFVVERWLQRYVGNISALPSVVPPDGNPTPTQSSTSADGGSPHHNRRVAISTSSSGSSVAYFDCWSSAYRLPRCY
jgi:hypothetical protein